MAQELTQEQEATLEYRHPDLQCDECDSIADERCPQCRRFYCVEHAGQFSHVCLGGMP